MQAVCLQHCPKKSVRHLCCVVPEQVTVPPTGGELEYVSNHGAGTVVLGPGHNTSSMRINAASVGQVNAINITTNTLTFTGAG